MRLSSLPSAAEGASVDGHPRRARVSVALICLARRAMPLSSAPSLPSRVEERRRGIAVPLTGLLAPARISRASGWLAEPVPLSHCGPGGVEERLALELARFVAEHGKLRYVHGPSTIWDPGLAACACEPLGSQTSPRRLAERARALARVANGWMDNFAQVRPRPGEAELLATADTSTEVTSPRQCTSEGTRSPLPARVELREGWLPADSARPAIRCFRTVGRWTRFSYRLKCRTVPTSVAATTPFRARAGTHG